MAVVLTLGVCQSLVAFQTDNLPPGTQNPSPFGTAQSADEFVPEQAFVVNERFAGWREAGDDNQQLSETLRSNWVMAGPYGALSGRIAGIEGADMGNLVVTLLNNGRIVTTTTPSEDATFTFPNVRTGAYALVGWGDNAFFAFGFNVIRHSEDAPAGIPRELQVTAVPNKTTINYDWIRYFSTAVKFRVYGRYTQGEGSEDLPRLYGFDGLSNHYPDAVPATSITHQPVSYSSNGLLMGRVHQITTLSGRPVDLRNTRVMLLQNDDVFAATTADNYGVFGFTEIPEGEYSCVAVGQDGMGCIGITVASAPDASPGEDGAAADGEAGHPIDFTMVPSETIGWLNHKAIETAYNRSITRPRPVTGQACNQCGGQGCNACGGCGHGNGFNGMNRKRRNIFRKFNDWFEELIYNDDGQRGIDGFLNTPGYNPRPGGYRPR